MKQKALYYLSFITILLAMLGMVYFFYLSFYPFEIVKLHKFVVNTLKVKSGQPIQVEMQFEKKMNYQAEIKWSLVDGYIYGIPRESIFRGSGNSQVKTYIVIPKNTPSGRYHLQVFIEYEITPIRKINYVWKSNEFTVTNSTIDL